MSDPLIYGKNQEAAVISVEPHDGYMDLFIQDTQGNVSTKQIRNKYWILSPNKLGSGWIRLKGDLHYKWGKQFDEREEFIKYRSIHRSKDTFSIYDPKEASLVNTGVTYFKGLKHKDVTSLAFDIESTGLEHNSDSKVLIISNTFRKNGEVSRKLFCYNEYASQGEMLVAWCDWVRKMDPTLIIGHNINSYDLPYLQHVADQENVQLNLGRDLSAIKFNNYDSFFRIDGSRQQAYKKIHIYGREIVDTLFLSVRYDIGRKYESYALKQIIKQEGLEVKDRQFYDANDIRFKYHIPEEWEKIKRYALHDADDTLALYDLMAPATFYWTQMVPKSFQSVIESATGSQINSILLRAYLQEGHSIPKTTETHHFEGAISHGIPGIHRNTLSFDVSSLYPSIMVEYRVFDEEKDPKGYFLKLVETLREQRLNDKRMAKETGDKYYSDLEQSRKIGINSAYGALAAPGLNFNCVEAAEFITETGREVLKKAIHWATGKDYEEWKKENNL